MALLTSLWLVNRPPLHDGAMIFANDGDSFTVKDAAQSQAVRLLGIDAPELSQICRNSVGESWECGKKARDALLELAPRGTHLRCHSVGIDQFDRALSRCQFDDDRDLAAELMLRGWAVATNEDYLAEEAQARGRKAGLWQGEFQNPAEWRAAHPRP